MFSFSRNITFSLSLVMVLGILFAGLYPFNYSPSNQVTRLDDKDGILFYGSGEAVSIEDTIWPHAGYSGQPITMELHLRPLRAYHEGVPHILSLCDRAGREVFYLGQWKNYMVMRLLGDKRFLTRIDREAGTPDFPESGQPVFLSFVFHEDRVELYADAKMAGVYVNFDLIGAIDRRPVRSIVFGNSSVGEHPWQGEIFRFSVFDGALDPSAILDRYRRSAEGENNIPMGEVIHYRFDSPQSKTVPNSAGQKWDLLIPETLTPLRREFLSLPKVDNFRKRWFYTDALLNLAGFVPLGLALAMLVSGSQSPRRMRTITLPVTAGFFLSLFIEVSQGFMVTRSSSLTDLFLNTVGTLAGALAFLALSRAPFSKLSR
jgi:hypothetical protein